MVGEDSVGDLASTTEAKIARWIDHHSAPAMITARTAIESLAAALGANAVSNRALQARRG